MDSVFNTTSVIQYILCYIFVYPNIFILFLFFNNFFRYKILSMKLFLLTTLKILLHYLLIEKSIFSLIHVTLQAIRLFFFVPLTAFKILFLHTICLDVWIFFFYLIFIAILESKELCFSLILESSQTFCLSLSSFIHSPYSFFGTSIRHMLEILAIFS